MCVRLGDSLGKACVPNNGGLLTGEDAKYVEKVRAKMRQDLASPS